MKEEVETSSSRRTGVPVVWGPTVGDLSGRPLGSRLPTVPSVTVGIVGRERVQGRSSGRVGSSSFTEGPWDIH